MARKRTRKVSDFLKTFAFLAFLAVGSAWFAAQSTVELRGVPQILDGDSLRLDGREIRLRGIDAPERDQICRSSASAENYQCGLKALQALKSLVDQGTVTCEGWENDKYGRLLAVCRVKKIELNKAMVLRGWAVSFGDYEGAEAIAKDGGTGLWSGEFDAPSNWRRQQADAHSSNWLKRFRFW